MKDIKEDDKTWSASIDYAEIKRTACHCVNATKNIKGTREGELYRGLGMILAGMVVLHSTGLYRNSVDWWLKRYLNDVYGLLH